MKYVSSILLIIVFVIDSLGQSRNNNTKWLIAISSGTAIPFGDFKSINLQKSVQTSSNGLYQFNFFDKKGNGAALKGYAGSLTLSKNLLNHFHFVSQFTFTSNGVRTSQIESYVSGIMSGQSGNDLQYVIIQNNYSTVSGLLGIGYYTQRKKNLLITPLIGISKLSFPDYTYTQLWYKDGRSQPPARVTFEHQGERKNSYSFAYGINIRLDYPLSEFLLIGITTEYLSADFDYNIELKSPGIDPVNRNDQVNYRNAVVAAYLGLKF
jgi:hypothetical protein